MKKGAKNTKVSSEEKFQALQKKVDKLIEEHESKFEEYKLSEDWEMGIDEAGRGPVLGNFHQNITYNTHSNFIIIIIL